MSKLYFKSSKNEKRLLGDVNSWEETRQIIQNYIDELHVKTKGPNAPKFQWLYTNIWYNDDENLTTLDIGSHTEFFLIEGNVMNIWKFNEENVYD